MDENINESNRERKRGGKGERERGEERKRFLIDCREVRIFNVNI